MSRNFWIGAVVVLLLAAAGTYVFFGRMAGHTAGETAVVPEAPVAPAPEPVPAPPAEPQHHPVSESPAAGLPALPDSDGAVREALARVFGAATLETLLLPQNIVRNLVATINSLDDSAPVAARLRPLAHVPGLPVVDGEGDALTLSPKNSARYTRYVDAMSQTGGRRAAQVYLRLYPLFQSAYEEMGFKGRYFNDRLVQVIDHLLATPQVQAPIQLLRPKVLYEFEDSDLEARSWGQKLLIRMGPENQAVVKAWLREVRATVVAQPPPKE